MKRKIQIALSEESWSILESITTEANDGFKNGSINYSDVMNEMVGSAKLDIRALQAKHTNVRKSLRLIASQKEIDIDSAIRALMDLKTKGAKRTTKNQMSMEGLEQ